MPFVKGKTVIRNPEVRRLRDLAILKMKLETGASSKAIGEKFNLNIKTVGDALTRAVRGDLAQRFEDELLQCLVPLAMSAVKEALARGDETVALEILKGTNILKKPGTPLIPQGDGDELELHIRAKRRFASGDTPIIGQSHSPQPPPISIENISEILGEVVDAGDLEGEQTAPADVIDLEPLDGHRTAIGTGDLDGE